MASSSTNLSLPSSSSTHRRKYDVFLSFRGEDTRQNFTAHLYAALCRKGINTFKDSLLRRGEKISPALLQAIEESRISIIIFSENYASSSWCLEELTKILECVEEGGHIALPVFHNVDPSHVKKLEGNFGEAFAKHEQGNGEKMEKVVKWRKALTEAAKISGWDSRNKDEYEVIEEIVTRILTDRTDASSSNMDGLVGMDSRIEDIVSLLCNGSDDVRIVGIWGMAGIGKTSIAKAVYERIWAKFEGCCFLGNVREDSQRYGLTYLEEKLFSTILGGQTKTEINCIKARLHSKKVLIVLDDVNNQQQLLSLVRNCDWFGQGSRIIITTRDKGLLNRVGAKLYAVEELAYDEAHNLFRWHAFEQNPITEDYMQLCNDAVDYIKGLPLALIVLGSFFCNKNIDEWKSALVKLKRIPHEDVHTKLKISFDGLEHTQKEIFLDIACFFKGEDKTFVQEILESCDFFPVIDIRVLIDKSLIIVSKNRLWMHDLLQEMGWEIVRQEDVKYPGNCSRLWVHDEVNDVLTTNVGTEAVEGIVFDFSVSKDLNLNVDTFAKMRNLRLLRFYNFQFGGSSEYLYGKRLIDSNHDDWRWRVYEMYNSLHNDSKLHLSGDFKFPSNKLRSLYWHGYPLKSLPSNFHPHKLVELNLCSSWLEQLWEGNKRLEKLKFIKLSHSQHLARTPDFSGAPNLRELILEGCTSLVEVHPSIGSLKQLLVLNFKGCKNLESFSSSIHTESLQILILSGCSKLKKFPEVQGNMKDLPELSLEGTAIKGLPSSIEYLTGLVLLNLKDCKMLETLPSSICKLTSLQTLILSGCSKLKKFPEVQGNMKDLTELSLEGTSIKGLPSSIEYLTGLVLLNLKDCKRLETLPSCICKLTSLQTLILSGCSKLKKFPEVQGNMKDLTELSLEGTSIKGLPSSIEYLTGLVLLNLKDCKRLETLPSSIFKLKSLNTLILSNCSRLEKLPEMQENMESLMDLFLDGTSIRQLPSSIGHLNRLVLLNLKNCKKLASFEESICKLTSVRTLVLSGCSKLKKLPDDLGSLQHLVELNADGSGIKEVPPSITFLSGLQSLSFAGCKGLECKRLSSYSLRSLNLSDCNLLQLPGDLSSLPSLNYLDLSGNSFITMPDSISQLSRLKMLLLMHCKSLQSLPKLPSRIEYLDAHGCTSLETLSFSLLAYKVEEFGNFEFKLTNCLRLVENQRIDIVEAILEGIQLVSSIPKFLKHGYWRRSSPDNSYNAFVPGSRIPEWFTHQSVGSSVRVELPPHWYNSKLMGLAVCVVFNIKSNEAWASHRIHCDLNDEYCFSSSINLSANELDEFNELDEVDEIWCNSAKRTRFIESGHTWFGYQSLAELDFNGFDRYLCGPVEVSFRGPPDVSSFEVKKCGVRVVYEQDENDRGCIFPLGKLLEDRDIAFCEHRWPDSRPPYLHYLCSRDANEKLQSGSSHGSGLELDLPYSSFASVSANTGNSIFGFNGSTSSNANNQSLGGTSSKIASIGSGIFGFSGSSSSTANNQSLGPTPFGAGSGSLVSAQTSSPAGTGIVSSTQSMPVQFGFPASPPSFGVAGAAPLNSGNSLFGSSTPATPFGSSSSGLSSSVSWPEASTFISSTSGITSNVFSSNWQTTKSPIFGSTSTGFSFGGSSASVAGSNSAPMVFGSCTSASSASLFSFNLSAGTASLSSFPSSQPVFGNYNSVFPFGSATGNHDQMNMEDSMAVDTVQASTPALPVFGQQVISPSPSSAFMFSSTPSSAQQNPATPQNPSPFQASSSLDFNAGGSFSLSTGGANSEGIHSYLNHYPCFSVDINGEPYVLDDYHELNELRYNSWERTRFIESDHTWFGYRSLAELDSDCFNRDLSSPVEASFDNLLWGRQYVSSFEVKKCGVREQDENDRESIFPSGKFLEDRDINFLEQSCPPRTPLHCVCFRDGIEKLHGGSSHGSQLELDLPNSRTENDNEKGKTVMTYESEDSDSDGPIVKRMKVSPVIQHKGGIALEGSPGKKIDH